MADVVVVGAGHNGLVAACYLARAGRRVLVLEALAQPGGGARTEERLPGHRFDLHSVAHNIINMTPILRELGLDEVGLEYQEMDPFSIAVHADGRRVRFHRSIERTVASIAESSPAEARSYAVFMGQAVPLVRALLPSIRGQGGPRTLAPAIWHGLRGLRPRPLETMRDLTGPYGSLLRRRLSSDLTRGPIAAFAAHAGVGPGVPGGALYGFWQAAYHLFGQWHARGGAQGLTDALVRRLTARGGELRCDAAVARIEAPAGRVQAVVLEDGSRIPARAVVTALDPKLALLGLLDPPLAGRAGADLAAARRGNVVQALVHVATDRLPPYAGARAGDWNGLQSFVDRLEDLEAGWIAAEAGLVPDPLPLYAFSTSALDDALAPAGRHSLYLACPTAPAQPRDGWPRRREDFVEAALETVAARAPGFRESILGVRAFLPDEMQADGRWPGAHPMHLDIALDQIGPLRPTRALASHRTPIAGLYVSGAGTAPAGGIAGTPGRQAALALLADARKPPRARARG